MLYHGKVQQHHSRVDVKSGIRGVGANRIGLVLFKNEPMTENNHHVNVAFTPLQSFIADMKNPYHRQAFVF